jgi:hypothetical protein
MASLSRDSGHLVPPLGPPCFLKEVLQNYGNNGNPAPQHAFIPVDLPRHPSSVPPQDPNQQSNFKEVQKEKEKNTSEALRRYQMWKNIELVHPSFEKPAFSPDPNQQTNSQEVQKGTGTEKDKPDYPEITNVTNDWIGTTNKLPLAFQLFEESMAQIIYGSNRIEDVGLNESMTRQLCAKVFRNLEAHATVFDFANPEYKEYFRGDLSKSSIVRGSSLAHTFLPMLTLRSRKKTSHTACQSIHIPCHGTRAEEPTNLPATHQENAYHSLRG